MSKNGYTLNELISSIGCLGVIALVIYVIVHFIIKAW